MFLFLAVLAFSADYPEPTSLFIFNTMDYGSKYYRIPAICRTNDGTIICACDMRHDSNADLAEPIQIIIRRSLDDGYTFLPAQIIAGTGPQGSGYGYSDPSLVVDRVTGAVLCVFNAGNRFQSSTASNQIRNVYCISYDNGATWSDPIDFTPQIYGYQCTDPQRKNWHAVFVVSGSGIQCDDGRIMFTIVCRKPNTNGYPIHVISTFDLGRTWHIGAAPATSGDETKVAQLANGSLLVSVRNSPRKFVISNDYGESWEEAVTRNDFTDPGCNGDLHRYTLISDGYDKNRLLHSNQFHASSRRNLTLKISYDEGTTWPYHKSIYPDLSAYSAIEIAGNGDILIFHERELKGATLYEMVLVRVTLEYLTDGNDTYKPPSSSAKEL